MIFFLMVILVVELHDWFEVLERMLSFVNEKEARLFFVTLDFKIEGVETEIVLFLLSIDIFSLTFIELL